ncbi:hypothetical protein A2619_03070 [candidate division WWE3 bacterium RIFOXYD1_FULL_39_9]|uniref:LysM domain-containing protein n=1 Tax=candidate division WWE3 bacterium RIFOXYD1_FULL_39_9 TaxID=1802649 RepID=A0A1F4X8L9_UNCKA|nr:MAG: hypothetical protein A2619_03070 [candidate division WWE3 bacterium RIFOXYD1_FULL_39_9]
MTDSNSDEKKTKDSLALIVGGIFILALVFTAYNYFNNNNATNTTGEENGSIVDRVRDILTNDEDKSKDLNGNGAMDVKQGSELTTETKTDPTNAEWVATDYQEGDIDGNSYTVVRGDTLWEIAEAVYGDGSQWVKILAANSNDVGFLANGQQALIVPGQVLVLP